MKITPGRRDHHSPPCQMRQAPCGGGCLPRTRQTLPKASRGVPRRLDGPVSSRKGRELPAYAGSGGVVRRWVSRCGSPDVAGEPPGHFVSGRVADVRAPLSRARGVECDGNAARSSRLAERHVRGDGGRPRAWLRLPGRGAPPPAGLKGGDSRRSGSGPRRRGDAAPDRVGPGKRWPPDPVGPRSKRWAPERRWGPLRRWTPRRSRTPPGCRRPSPTPRGAARAGPAVPPAGQA